MRARVCLFNLWDRPGEDIFRRVKKPTTHNLEILSFHYRYRLENGEELYFTKKKKNLAKLFFLLWNEGRARAYGFVTDFNL